MPLAIELAAGRVGLISLEQIDQHLQDGLAVLARSATTGAPVLDRRQTLVAALQWGYDLLTDIEKCFFQRLSVFPASFTLAGAQAVGGEELAYQALDLLGSLVEKSMLVVVETPAHGSARYRMLEPVRQFAREKLKGNAEGEAARNRLLQWVFEWVAALEPRLQSAAAVREMQAIEAEYESIRSALRWSIISRQIEKGMRLTAGLFYYWFRYRSIDEGRAWAEELLNAAVVLNTIPAELTAQVAFVSGRLACRQGDHGVAQKRGEQSVALARAAGDRRAEGRALDLLGLAAHDVGDFQRAIAYHQEALHLRRQLEERYDIAVSLNNLGIAYFDTANYPASRRCFEEALELSQSAGFSLLAPLTNLAEIALVEGSTSDAVAYAQQAIPLSRATGDEHTYAVCLRILGGAARMESDWATARLYAQQALQIFQGLRTPLWEGEVLGDLGDVAGQSGDYEAARQAYFAGLQAHRKAGWGRGQAENLLRLSMLASLSGQPATARAHLEEALDILEGKGFRHVMIEALEAAALYWATDDEQRASNLLGTARSERQRLNLPLLPPQREWIDPLKSRLSLPSQPSLAFQDAWQAARKFTQPDVPELYTPVVPRDNIQLNLLGLGDAYISLGDRLITPSAWVYQKSRELLFYLAEHGPSSKAKIGLDLWPDASTEQLRNYFHRCLHFARRALEDKEWILFENGCYFLNPQRLICYDVLEFEAAIDQVANFGDLPEFTPGLRSKAIQILKRAVGYWRGDFLSNLDIGEWATTRRSALRMAYLKALLNLGKLHFNEAHYNDAMMRYRQVLAEDAYVEEAHRQLMRCFARQGMPGEALKQYRELQTLLAGTFDSAPMLETVLLYERIRLGEDV